LLTLLQPNRRKLWRLTCSEGKGEIVTGEAVSKSALRAAVQIPRLSRHNFEDHNRFVRYGSGWQVVRVGIQQLAICIQPIAFLGEEAVGQTE
jgi:hypothetical protein